MEPQGYALITGASYGIGEEFAWQLAARGWSLILVARSQDRLVQLRTDLMGEYADIDVLCVALDLTAPDAPAELFQKTKYAKVKISLLINNAGFGAFGEFTSIERERQRQMLNLNIAALVELTHLYLQPMMHREAGGIINIASVAGFAPLPYCAVYAATKAFVVSFSQALYEEARQHGVQVMVVNPGSTRTNFFEVAGHGAFSNSSMQTAEQVVAESIRAFERDRRSVTTGVSNRLLVLALGLVPVSWVTAVVGKKMRQRIVID